MTVPAQRIMRGFPARTALLAATALALAFGSAVPPAPAGDPAASPSAGAIVPPASGDTLETVKPKIAALLAALQSAHADLDISLADKGERKIRTGSLQMARGQGAYVELTRKKKTHEYFATADVIWDYDHKAKEAKSIPTSLPMLGRLVGAAIQLDVFVALEPDSMKYEGTSTAEGEPCWVVTGKSPGTLRAMGVPSVKLHVWVSQKDGLPRLITIPDEKDLQVILRKVATNTPVAPERLVFTPPKGVKTKNIFGF